MKKQYFTFKVKATRKGYKAYATYDQDGEQIHFNRQKTTLNELKECIKKEYEDKNIGLYCRFLVD